MPTLVVCTGFEFGTTAGMATGNGGNRVFDSVGGSPSVVATSPRSGDFCLQLTSAATGTQNVTWNTNTLGAGGTVLVAVVHLYVATHASGGNDAIGVFPAVGSGGFVFTNSDQRIYAGIASGDGDQQGPVLSTNTWYRVDLKFDVSGGQTTLDWAVDGTAQTQATKTQAASTIAEFTIGRTAGSATFTYRYDDVAVGLTSGDYPLGAHKALLLKPDTGGTTAEIGTANATSRFITNSTADATHNSANILAAISEVPPLIGATATGVCQRTSGSGNALGIPMTTYSLQAGESVSGMRVLVCGWASATQANNIGLRTFNGTTETTLFAAADPAFDNSTTTPAWLCKMATLANFDTQTELDALVIRYGYSTDISPLPGAHAIYAEVAIKDAGATPISLSDTGVGSETASAAAAAPVSDTGTGAESLAVASTVPVTDSGTGTESLSIAVPVDLADSGTGTETLATGIAIGLSDTGAGTETPTVGAAFNLTDTGTGAETSQVAAAVPLTQSGTGTESLTTAATALLADSGTGTESLTAGIAIPLADSGTVTESLTVLPIVALPDAGSGAEALSIGVLAALAEAGAAAELLALAAAITLPDTGVGAEALAVGLAVVLSDSGGGVDALDTAEPPAVILRPFTGTVTRPATGTTAQPTSGTLARPATGTNTRPDTGTTPRP